MDKYIPEDATFEDIYDFDEFVVKSKAPSRPKGTYTLDDAGEPLRPLNRPKIDETNVRFPPILIGNKKGGNTLRPAASVSQVPCLAPVKGIHGPSYDAKGKLTEQARAQQYVYVTEKRAQSLDMKAKTEKGTGLQMPVPVQSRQTNLTAGPDTKSSTDKRAQLNHHRHTATHNAGDRGIQAPTPVYRDTVTPASNKAYKEIIDAADINKRLNVYNSTAHRTAADQRFPDNRNRLPCLPAVTNTKNCTVIRQTEAIKIGEYEQEFKELMKVPFDPSKDPRILAYEERINSRPPRYTSTVRLDLTDKTACRTLASELTRHETLDVECAFQPTPPVAPRPPSGAPQTGYRRRQYKPANQTISINALPGASPQNEKEAGTGSNMADMPKKVRKQMNRYFNA